MRKFVILLMLFSAPSMANLWKSCGIGHWIAGPTWNGYLAITTNVTWDLGTTATTSNSLSPGTCAGPFWSAATFIKDTYPKLEEDTAQGQGEHLMAMLDIFGCDLDARPEVVNQIRTQFSDIVTSPNYEQLDQLEKAENYYYMIEETMPQFAGQCSAV
ncbi:DUF3015 family protein [Vibrio sp. SCSIO 43136]|uniref:DUF3015 family protein n=1 Tax=Vibrio sp. SCSIO 43136 TaxID=2819101 RepID=UPI0020755288|nr:DUF3015 family protein [Vibrio sp. SCSIO 43136]USD68066.1 DUF3015 family protein [Vibrio sp. SCSIO 43136]